MITSSTLLRTFLLVIVITILMGAVQPPIAKAQDPAAEFQRLIDQSDALAPVYGPENADLPFGIFEGCPECTWSAGQSLTDVRVHLELIWPADSLLTGTVSIAVRQAGPELPGVVDPNVFVISPASWVAGGEVGSLTSVPATIDIIVSGDAGYLAVDDQLVGTADLSGVPDPGDVVVTAVAYGFEEPSPVSILDFTVWDIGFSESSAGPHSETDASAVTDAEMFQTHRLAALAETPVYGPASGTLPHDPERVTIDDPVVSVSDFSARVECVAPVLPASGYWDCGFNFRDLTSDANYSLIVVSDGSWFFDIGSGATLLQGTLDPSIDLSSGRMTLELIAVGSSGYFAVNDQFVSALDLSAHSGPGTVAIATSFYEETYVANGATVFEDFTIVSFDTAGDQEQVAAQQSSSGSARSTGQAGNSYSDSRFGYSLTWDETWTVVGPVAGQSENLLRLTNGPVTADIYGQAGGGTDAATCLNNLLAYYQNTAGYSNASFVLDADAEPIVSAGSETALGLLTFTFIDSQGSANIIYDYALCAVAGGGQSLVVLEQYLNPDDYESQLEAMNALQMGIRLDGEVAGSGGVVDSESEAQVEQRYTDPTYGFSLAWDSSWTQQAGAGDDDGTALVLTRDRATAVLSAAESNAQTATECFQELIDGYLADPAYSNVRFVTGPVGLPIKTDGDYVATGLLQYGLTSADPATLGYDYVLCAKMPDSDIMVYLEQFIPADEFIHFKPEMEALQSGLWVVPEKSVSPPGLTGLHFAILPVSDADRAILNQIITATDVQPPLAGPAEVDLVMQGAEAATWSAGVSGIDYRVHVELLPPAGQLDADWELQIDFRAAGFGRDSFYLGSDGVISSNGIDGYRDSVPQTIDLIALGDIAYLAFDGELVGVVGIEAWMQPGDIVISAVNSTQPAGTSTMHLSNVTIWDVSNQA